MIRQYSDQLVRGFLQNLDSGDAIACLLNPEALSVALTVNYAAKATQGGDFWRLQYQNTTNPSIEFTLTFDRRIFMRRFMPGGGWDQNLSTLVEKFEGMRRFLMALCYPIGKATDPIRRAPPAVLLVWPSYLAIKAVVKSLKLKDTVWDRFLYPVVFSADLSFEEIRRYRLSSAEVAKGGMFRG